MAAGGTPSNVRLGPGRLSYAPLLTAEPTSASAALPSAWIPVGYTEDGSEFTNELTTENVFVAEEIDPIGNEQTQRITRITFQLAEMTKRNLDLVLAGGGQATNNGDAYEPPDAGVATPVMFVWDRDLTDTPTATNVRWIFRRCLPSGTVAKPHRKAPQKSVLPVTFECVKPAGGTAPFKVYPNAAGHIA